MPSERIAVGLLVMSIRNINCSSMHRIVVAAVLELVSNATTDLKLVCRCDRYIASVEETVYIAPE
jgi:hypothetical protein